MKPEMIAALVCREFGWDYETYENQPKWFIDIILSMLREEAAVQKAKS